MSGYILRNFCHCTNLQFARTEGPRYGKLHSTDVERIISTCNTLKTDHCQCFYIDTKNRHLYNHFIMPSSEWDPCLHGCIKDITESGRLQEQWSSFNFQGFFQRQASRAMKAREKGLRKKKMKIRILRQKFQR